MDVPMRDLSFDPAQTPGLSERLLRSHHQNNYGGAVKRLGAIRRQLAELPFAETPDYALNGLKREELVAANSMLLHELYFDSLGGAGQEMVPAMALALSASFGSVTRWRDEFVAMGRALGGGSGWVLLSWLPREARLLNQWAADHTHGLAGATPILALDMYEHAYHLDHGAQAGAYVDAFMANVAWARVYERYQQAIHRASEGLAADPQRLDAALLLDVRRAAIFEQARSMLPGARWRDPAEVDRWAAELARDREVVVYCVHGHEVGRATALRLRAAGVRAGFLVGGIDAWARAGRPLQPKEDAS
ncbi:MAG TPA: Fe-Mn family superoxide dismutase [Roseateles sp.]|nr:Fe-Mn family superoxide dismutase [Roseateles sp.]